MKLLHVTTVPITLFFFTGHIAFLKQNEVEVGAVSSPDPELQQIGFREGIPVYPLEMARQPSPMKDLISLYGLYNIFKSENPDLVHLTTPKAGLIGTMAARMAGVKGVILSIFGLPQMTKTGVLKRLLDMTTRLSCKLADMVWCDSFSMREHIIQERLCPAGKVVVLGQGSVNGIDAKGRFNPDRYGPEIRKEIRDRYQIPENSILLGFVGRIVGDKGMRELALAWRMLSDRFPEMHIIMIGPFESKDPIPIEDERLFKTHARIHLTGWRRDIPEHLRAMDIFVNPSYREGFGVANLEASAMGLPVVSTRIPGCVDSVKDGLTGTLVTPRDSRSLTNAVQNYLDDEILRKKHGNAGRLRVLQDFQPDGLCRELLLKYRMILRRKLI